jgi:hypothetical protein
MAIRTFYSTLAHIPHHRAFPLPLSRFFSSCPFQVLGLANRGTAYVQVQAKYKELAIKFHPDSSGCVKSTNQFIRIKDAFNSIVEGPSGIAVLRGDHAYKDRQCTDGNESENDGKANACHQDEQKWHLHPSVNPQILHEIADAAEKLNPGGLDRGGMWQYANMISNLRERSGMDGLPPLRVEDGGYAAKESNETRIRARRKRK